MTIKGDLQQDESINFNVLLLNILPQSNVNLVILFMKFVVITLVMLHSIPEMGNLFQVKYQHFKSNFKNILASQKN